MPSKETPSGSCEKTGGGEWTALREALRRHSFYYGDRYFVKCFCGWVNDAPIGYANGWESWAEHFLEALATAAPAPPAPLNDLIEQMADLADEFEERYQREGEPHHAVTIDSGVLRKVLDDLAMDMRAALAPPQDGQGAELHPEGTITVNAVTGPNGPFSIPPQGGSSSDLAGPSNLKVGDEVWVRAKVMQFIEPEHNGVEILLEIGRNELMRTWCNASDLSKAEREVATATTEYDTECPARDSKYQCTLDRNHAGPHKAHGFDRVLHEWTQPSLPEAVAGNASAPVGEPRKDGQDDILAALGDAMAERGLSLYWNMNRMDESAKALLDRVVEAALVAPQREAGTISPVGPNGTNSNDAAPASAPVGEESVKDFDRAEGLYLKFSEPDFGRDTPVVIERVNGDCSVSKFIIARDEAHELINQLCEFLHVAPVGEKRQPSGPTFEQWWHDEGARIVRTTNCTRYESMKEAWRAALSSEHAGQPSGVGEPRELLPCPFCGSKAEIVKNDFPPRNKWWHPSCTKYTCPAHVVEQDEQGGTQCDVFTDEEARNLWNTRTVAPREVGEGLREAQTLEHAADNAANEILERLFIRNHVLRDEEGKCAPIMEHEEMAEIILSKLAALAAPAPKPAPPDERAK